MSIDILVLFSLLMLSPPGQEPPAKPAVFTVDRLCGKLDRVEEIASNVDPSTVIEERKTSLGKVVVQLYQRNENSECCEALPFVAEGGRPFQLSKGQYRDILAGCPKESLRIHEGDSFRGLPESALG